MTTYRPFREFPLTALQEARVEANANGDRIAYELIDALICHRLDMNDSALEATARAIGQIVVKKKREEREADRVAAMEVA